MQNYSKRLLTPIPKLYINPPTQAKRLAAVLLVNEDIDIFNIFIYYPNTVDTWHEVKL